jgi:hypothetical protein
VRERILAIYPGLDKARLVLASPASAPAGAVALRISGRPASGAVLGVMTSPQQVLGVPAARGQTNVAVTYDASPATVLGSLSPAGVPKKTKVPWIAIGGAVAVAGVAGAALLFRSGGAPDQPAPAAAGLVMSAIAAKAAAPLPVEAPAELALPAAPAASAAEPVAASKQVAPSPPAGKASAALAGVARPPGKGPAPAKERPAKPNGQVGGVGIANEF